MQESSRRLFGTSGIRGLVNEFLTPEVAAKAGLTFATFLGVKAAGGIQTTEQALAMLSAGATRIGSSKSTKLIEGLAPEHE